MLGSYGLGGSFSKYQEEDGHADSGNEDTLLFPEFDGSMVNWPRLGTMPSAKETLTSLRTDWIIALGTNAEDSTEDEIRQALAKVKIDKLRGRIYCFRKIGQRNPSRAFFEFILGLK